MNPPIPPTPSCVVKGPKSSELKCQRDLRWMELILSFCLKAPGVGFEPTIPFGDRVSNPAP